MNKLSRAICAAFVLFLIVGGLAFAQRTGRPSAPAPVAPVLPAAMYKLQVVPTPANAMVLVNNMAAANNVWTLPAGVYQVTASAYGYASSSVQLSLTGNVTLPVILKATGAAQVAPQPVQPAQPAVVVVPTANIDSLIQQLQGLKDPETATNKPGTILSETAVPGSEQVAAPEQGFDDTGAPVTYIRKTAMYEASATFDKSVLLNPGADVIYPGSVIYGESLDDGTYLEFMKGVKRPVKISYDLTGAKGAVSETFIPTLSNFRDVHNRILGKIAGGASTSFTFEEISVSEESDFTVKFNAGVSYSNPIVEASVKGGFTWGKGDKRNKYLVKFMQTFYTVDIDQGRDTFLFENFNVADFNGYRPVYVSSVAYGRLAYLSVESTESWNTIKTTLEAAASAKLANVDFNADLETDYNRIKRNTTINITVIGGSKVATGIDSFMAMLTEDSFSRDNPGKIVAYKLRFVDDNSIANIKFAGSYPLTSTETVVGKGYDVKAELYKFVSRVDDNGSEAEFYGDFRAYLVDNGQELDKGPFWSYNEKRTYVVREISDNNRADVISLNLPTIRNSMLRLKGRGLREDDNSGDESFKDVDLDISLGDLSGQTKTYVIKSDYKKGKGEYIEFHIRVSVTPKY